LLGRLRLPLEVPPAVVARAASAIALVCAMFGHSVDALVDVVGRLESGTDGTTPRVGLDVSITCTRGCI
jgi:hypothetical protein